MPRIIPLIAIFTSICMFNMAPPYAFAMIASHKPTTAEIEEAIKQRHYEPIRNLLYNWPHQISQDVLKILNEAGNFHLPIAYMLCRHYTRAYLERKHGWHRNAIELALLPINAYYYAVMVKLLIILTQAMVRKNPPHHISHALVVLELFGKRTAALIDSIKCPPNTVQATILHIAETWGDTDDQSQELFKQAYAKLPSYEWLFLCSENNFYGSSHMVYARPVRSMMETQAPAVLQMPADLSNLYNIFIASIDYSQEENPCAD